jgi:hypothetical protein
VSIGLVYGFGLKHIDKIIIYVLSLALFYPLANKYLNFSFPKFNLHIYYNPRIIASILFFFITAFVIIHIAFLGHVPFISAYNILDYYDIAFIRQSITEHDSTLIKYMSAFMIKGIIPFSLLYASIVNRKYFYLLLPVAIFYSISLMQKSLIVTVLLPITIYLLLQRKYILTLICTLTFIVGVFLLVYATNPSLRATQEEIKAEMKQRGHLYLEHEDVGTIVAFLSASDAIYTRVFVTTGLVSGYWFEKIPSQFPYTKGCGYHFLAPLIGCDYKDFDYSRKIYEATYIKESKIGLKGTVTVANFVYDYANFGYIGLVLSAIIISVFFVLLNTIYKDDFNWLISNNVLFVFWLSSGQFSTTLLSGGWVLAILLYFFLVRNKKLLAFE